MRTRARLLTGLLVMALAASLGGCAQGDRGPTGSSGNEAQEPSPTPSEVEPEGARLVQDKCDACHSLDRVESADKDKTQWATTVERMQGNGLSVTDEEKSAIIDYLAERDSRR